MFTDIVNLEGSARTVQSSGDVERS